MAGEDYFDFEINKNWLFFVDTLVCEPSNLDSGNSGANKLHNVHGTQHIKGVVGSMQLGDIEEKLHLLIVDIE